MAAADLVGLGGSSKPDGETPPPEEKEGRKSSNAKNTKKSKGNASGKKRGGASDDGDKAVAKTGGGAAAGSGEGKVQKITAMSIIKDQMGILPPVPALPEAKEDGPLKKKAPGASTAGGNDDQMIVDEHGEKTSFPLLLHNVVTDPATDDCVQWLSCGTRFLISDKKKFAKDILPRFYGPAKFTSFTRRLKRWSFARVPSGPFMGAYFNPNFRRGEPELAHRVRYNHPSPLSGAGLAMQQQKLAAVKGANINMMPMNMNMAGMSDNERAELFRQMNGGMAPMMGGMNMGMMGMNYGMMMGGHMMNPNMMMGGGGGSGQGGYGNDEGKSDDMAGGGGGGPNPTTLAMLMEQQERQRLAFQQQMGGEGSNQESMNGMNNQSGGATNASFSNLLGGQGGGGGGGAQGIGNFPGGGGYGHGGPGMMGQGNLNAILAQYMTQGGGNRGTGNQGKTEEGDKE